MSLSVWGAWIEISKSSPHRCARHTSLSVWGAWIEIQNLACMSSYYTSLSVWGAWIEIAPIGDVVKGVKCRSPYGERGLKSKKTKEDRIKKGSLSVWGAWIEINILMAPNQIHLPSLSVWGAWIEIMR